MKNQSRERDLVTTRLKQLIADLFGPDLTASEGVADHARLAGNGLGLDPSEAFELALCIEEEFGIALCDRPGTDRVFQSVASLVGLILASLRVKEAARRERLAVRPNLTVALAAPA
jgi:acyl carrier protein